MAYPPGNTSSNRGPSNLNKGCIVNTRYVGPKDRLQGKACMVRETGNPATVEAKFSDEMTGMSEAWHPMPRRDFEYWSERA